MTQPTTRAHLRLTALLLAMLAAAGSALAQNTSTPSPSAAPKDDTIVLSPFTVNTAKDVGYLAADSLLAGRLSTELLKTPSDISVLTRDFIDDIGATDYIQASSYLTNTYVTQPAGQDFGAQNNFRGLGGGFPTRNYFKHNNVLDFYNVERVESARGPNALLFGDGIVGGIINTVTKQARLGRTTRQVGVRVDSEGSLRGTFRLSVCKKNSGDAPSVAFGYPFAETEEAWIPIGLSDPNGSVDGQNSDLNGAMRRAVVNALDFLEHDRGMDRATAYAYLSAAADFTVSQVVDRTVGVHGQIFKSHFE